MKKILAVILSVLIVLSALPISLLSVFAESSSEGIVADTPTIHSWKEFFGKSDDGSVNTENAGGIWVDKSVFTTDTIKTTFPHLDKALAPSENNFGEENFLVSLATIGSNKEIVGYSTIPTDTMLVLDLSSSMYGNTGKNADTVTKMVKAVNNAIEKLQSLNNYNRVGVVIYFGGPDYNQATSSAYKVLLGLDRYTYSGSDKNYSFLKVGLSGGKLDSIAVNSNVKNSANKTVSGSHTVPGISGTYTQLGILAAMNEMLKVDPKIPSNSPYQAGKTRIPIMVLMSDGEPTAATSNFSQMVNAETGNNTVAYRNPAESDFMTQLTAAYARNKIDAHYADTTPVFYTLSLGSSISLDVMDPVYNDEISAAVLKNPSAYSAERVKKANNNKKIAEYWDTLIQNNKVSFDVYNCKGQWNNAQVRVNLTVNKASGFPSDVAQKYYVDKSFTASTADDLMNAFASIVNAIVIQSRYYGTLVNNNDHDNDGFISFSDEIGAFMEVKAVKGIHMGEGKLHTGSIFAQYLKEGKLFNNNVPTEYGFELIHAMKNRMGIDESQFYELLHYAQELGTIYYKNDDDFANYVVWYADADGKYLAPYIDGTLPKGNAAKYIIKSFIYLGEETASHAASDMMYSMIRVREEIATGRQFVDASLPASLLPLITYSIELNNVTNDWDSGDIKSVKTNIDEMHPAVLLYEVGLKNDITPYNIDEKVGHDYHYQNGVYTFYSNRWTDDNGKVADYNIGEIGEDIFLSQEIHTTIVNLEPSLENEMYYYTDDTKVYKKSGNSYALLSGSENLSQNGEYYWKQQVVIKGKTENTVKSVYHKIAASVLEPSFDNDSSNDCLFKDNSGWFVKGGTPKNDRTAFDHLKAKNETETIKFSNVVRIEENSILGANDYIVYSYQGNNGKLTVAPKQGIKITKTVPNVVENAPTSFDFEINLKATKLDSEYTYRLEKANGTVSEGKLPVKNGVIEASISAGDVLYIVDLPTGAEYTVNEKFLSEYKAVSFNNTGIVKEYEIEDVDFLNVPRTYGTLTVEKDVTHDFGNAVLPSALINKEFDITVDFFGQGTDLIIAPQGLAPRAIEGGVSYSFKLKDGESLQFVNIPDGVTYKVNEKLENQNVGDKDYGFALDQRLSLNLSGTIIGDIIANLVNDYNFAPVNIDINVKGKKTVTGPNYVWEDGHIYTVMLEKGVHGNDGHFEIDPNFTPIKAEIKKSDNGQYTIAFNETYTEIGTYGYRIYEVVPDNKIDNISYDRSIGMFHVEVTDNDADGKLETAVHSQFSTVSVTGDQNTGFIVEKDFVNVYKAHELKFQVKKAINGNEIPGIKEDIIFGLFENTSDKAPKLIALTDANGIANFELDILHEDYLTPKTYYIRELEPELSAAVVGMTYNTDFMYKFTIDWSDISADKPTVLWTDMNGNPVSDSELVITNDFDDVLLSEPAINIKGIKTISGNRTELKDKEFRFALFDCGPNFTASATNVRQIVRNDAAGNFEFKNITFDSTGTKYMIIREMNDSADGIVYDGARYHITVNVVKTIDASGKIVLSVDKADGGSVSIVKAGSGLVANDIVTFENKYLVEDEKEVTFTGVKNVMNVTTYENAFTFTLTEKTDSTFNNVKNGGIKLTTGNGVNGDLTKIKFDKIKFTQPGEYYFTIEEKIPEGAVNNFYKGMTFDDTKYNITVKVEDDTKGKLKDPVITYHGYNTSNPIVFTNVYSATPTSITLAGNKTLTGRELKAGEFEFNLYKADQNYVITGSDPIAKLYNDKDGKYSVKLDYELKDVGTHYYVLKETIPSEKKGVHFDVHEYHIPIVVVNVGDGTLAAFTNSDLDLQKLDFTNIYRTENTSFSISGKKLLKDKELKEGMFEFELLDVNGKVMATATNDEKGEFGFENIALASARTHVFTIIEKNAGQTIDGITYDDTQFTVTAEVTDNGEGKLILSDVKYLKGAKEVEEIEFVNIFTPEKPKDEEEPKEDPKDEEKPDEEIKTPQMGDDTNIILMILSLLTSLALMVVLAFFRKKNKA